MILQEIEHIKLAVTCKSIISSFYTTTWFPVTQSNTLIEILFGMVHKITVFICGMPTVKLIPELPIPRGDTSVPQQHRVLFPTWCPKGGQGMLYWTDDHPRSCSTWTHRPAASEGLFHFARRSTRWAWRDLGAQQPLENELLPTIACGPDQVRSRKQNNLLKCWNSETILAMHKSIHIHWCTLVVWRTCDYLLRYRVQICQNGK